MRARSWRAYGAIAGAVGLTLPWVYAWLTTGIGTFTGGRGTVGLYPQVAVTAGAIVGGGFLLSWGADAAEEDVPTAIAIAGLAVVAVAPEYAVDAYYAWKAGAHPGVGHAAHMAIANMTGANRILIGLGWAFIVLYAVYETRRGGIDDDSVVSRDGVLADAVTLGPGLSVEYLFLFLATVYGFLVPFRGIDAVDTLVLVGLYAGYAWFVVKQGEETGGAEAGVAAYLADRSAWVRRGVVAAFFLYAGFLIVTAVEPFANGLEHLGMRFGLSRFFVVQWLAPVASESPELIVTAYLVRKARAAGALNALVSSKLNQWTLLVGTLVVVYSVSLGGYASFPLTPQQRGEIWLTAAYGLLALALLCDLRVSARESLVLVGTLAVQLVPWVHTYTRLLALTGAYTALALGIFVVRRQALVETLGLGLGRRDESDVSVADAN